MMRSMLRKNIVDRLSMQEVLSRIMVSFLGQRILRNQETIHLMLSLPTVSCVHVLAKINLDSNKNLISTPRTASKNHNTVAGNVALKHSN